VLDRDTLAGRSSIPLRLPADGARSATTQRRALASAAPNSAPRSAPPGAWSNWLRCPRPGYRLLMRAQADQGDVPAALITCERLRTVLREELGVAPGPLVQKLLAELLG
jgi:hypothetical protein